MENNKLIAEFMGGYQYDQEGNFVTFDLTDNMFSHDTILLENLKFHTDWNWLMQVVEKIESLDYMVIHNFYISKFEVVIKAEHNRVFKDIHIANKTKIEAVYNACVEFIKWYNEQKSA